MKKLVFPLINPCLLQNAASRNPTLFNLRSTRFQHVPSIKPEDEKHDRNPTYDIVILGASGFTGKYVLREALKFLNSSPNSSLKTLALAGRNPSKLSEALSWAAPSHPSIPFLVVDTTNRPSLRRMASQAKLILNCVGPFRHHGLHVVEACVAAGCDYMDICVESDFIERMNAVYHERAVENGSLMVSACGIDSVPAELGFLFNAKEWVSPAVVNRVQTYVNLESDTRVVVNSATYESAVLGIANAGELKELRRSRRKTARPVIVGPEPGKGPIIEHQKKIGLWAVKLPSVDTSIVRRTLSCLAANPGGLQGINEKPDQQEQRTRFWSTIKPAHFGMKIASKSLLNVFGFIAVGMSIGGLGRFSIGKSLLLKYPEVFSLGWFRKGGPTEAEVDSSSFEMWFVGHGYSDHKNLDSSCKPDMEIITRLKGPEFGYVTTSIILIQCALIVLNQRNRLPKGGIYTRAIFGPTDLQKRLQKNGISFDIISKSVVNS